MRKQHGASRSGKIGLRCVFSRESVAPPEMTCAPEQAESATRRDSSLNCHGYGSSVTVTASFGMAAAGETIAQLLAAKALAGSAKAVL